MKNIKYLLSAYILSFVFSFMLYIFEPITMYANNVNDFWFDLYLILPPMIITASIMFLLMSIGFTIIYFINKKFSDKLKVYNIIFLITFVCFIGFYIQGNYLVSGLPHLDGSNIDWSKYTKQEILSCLVYLVIIVAVVISSIKFKMKSVVSISKYITLAVFIMLLTGFITTCTTTKGLYHKKRMALATIANYNKASKDKNFYIFLIDSVDSVYFEKTIGDKKLNESFKDFTYFKDTVSVYGYTRESVPQILSGKPNYNKEVFGVYSTRAMNNSLLIKELEKRDYSINIYDAELIWDSERSLVADNYIEAKRQINYVEYIKNQTKYILFKYLPFNLKKYSRIEAMYFNNSKVEQEIQYFDWGNWENNDIYTEEKIETIDDKYFHFIHLEGAHVPFGMCSDFTYNEKCGYADKIEATLKLIDNYVNRLKEYDVYDNASIIILSDHGYNFLSNDGRQNPILFIKGVDEHHDMLRSDIPVSYNDLDSAYVDLLNGKKSNELFEGIEYPRERQYILYEFLHEDHMVEYVQKGKAWDNDTMVLTGREFNR